MGHEVRGAGSGARRRRQSLAAAPLAAWLAVLPALVPACGGAERGAQAYTTRDSAGVTIVENEQPVWPEGTGWTIAEAPSLEIGALEGDQEYLLYQVRGAIRLADGRVLVANAGTHELRFFDDRGRFLSAVGRQGGGPGEFEQLGLVSLLDSDTLLTWDYQHRRLSLFDTQGRFLRSFPLGTPGATFRDPVGVLASGSLLVTTVGMFTPGSPSGIVRDTATYFRYDLEGALLDTVGRFPRSESLVRSDASSVSVTSLPFGRSGVVVVDGDGFYHGWTDAYDIRRYDATGRLARIIRRRHAPAPLSSQHIARFEQERMDGARDENQRRFWERMLADVTYPGTLPAFRSLHRDDEGYLWVHRYAAPGEDARWWDVFDREGRWLGPVAVPNGLGVMQIGSDFVLGRGRDELDVEHVRVHRLARIAR